MHMLRLSLIALAALALVGCGVPGPLEAYPNAATPDQCRAAQSQEAAQLRSAEANPGLFGGLFAASRQSNARERMAVKLEACLVRVSGGKRFAVAAGLGERVTSLSACRQRAGVFQGGAAICPGQ